MPELLEYPTERPQELVNWSDEERRERAEDIKAAWQYYDGDMRPPIKVRAGQPDDNVIVNLVAKMLDQSVELLMGEMPEFSLDDEKERSPAEQMLDMLWDTNSGPIFLNNMATQGGLTGHCFVKILPTDNPAKPIRLVNLKPEQVTVWWRPDDMEVVTAYMIYWSQRDVEYRQDHINQGTSWRIVDMVRQGSRQWNVLNDQIWPYAWAQIVDWQNLPEPRDYYGQADLTNPHLNDDLNFINSNIQRIIRYHAHPRTIGTGFRASDMTDTAVDALWTIPNADARVDNLEMQSDLSSSMQQAQAIQAQFWSEHRGFDMTSIKDRLGQLTNFGLRVLMADALNKASTKRELYGQGLTEINRRALALMNQGEDNMTRIQWPSMLPENDMETAEIQQILLDLGLTSKATAAQALGLDWEQEQQRIEEERMTSDEAAFGAFERGLGANVGAIALRQRLEAAGIGGAA